MDRQSTMNKRAAFTLVELLIVIAILGMLVAIILPTLRRARVLAERSGCRSHLRSVAMGLHMYLNDRGGRMPYAAAMPSLNLTDEPRIRDVLTPYIEDGRVFLCPGDPDEKYFRREGSSYEYHTTLGGRKVEESFLSRRFGEHNVWVMHDYEPFHGPPGKLGSSSYLFADGHVGNLERK